MMMFCRVLNARSAAWRRESSWRFSARSAASFWSISASRAVARGGRVVGRICGVCWLQQAPLQ